MLRYLEAGLERTKRQVRLTDPGRLFLGQARLILTLADRAAVAVRAESGARGAIHVVRVGFAYWMDLTRLAGAVKRMGEHQPAVRLQIRMMSVPLQLVALRENEIDVAFIRPPVADPGLSSQLLVREPFVAALPSRHRLRASTQIPLPALADEPFILFPRASVPQFYDLTLRICRESGFVPHVREEADHPDLLLRLVAAGLGIALVPASTANTPKRGVVFRGIDRSPVILETAVAWRKNPSPAVNALLDVVQEVFRAPPAHPRLDEESEETVRRVRRTV